MTAPPCILIGDPFGGSAGLRLPGLALSSDYLAVKMGAPAALRERRRWLVRNVSRIKRPTRSADISAPQCPAKCSLSANSHDARVISTGKERGGTSRRKPASDPTMSRSGQWSNPGYERHPPPGIRRAGRLASDIGHPGYTRYSDLPNRMAQSARKVPGIAEGGLWEKRNA